jgi:hypothetical protein
LGEALSNAKAVISTTQDEVSTFVMTLRNLDGSRLRSAQRTGFLGKWEQLRRTVRQALHTSDDALDESRGANLDSTLDATRAELRRSKELLDCFLDDLLTISSRHKRLDCAHDERPQRWIDALKRTLVPSWVAYGAPPPPPMPAAPPAPAVAAPAPAAMGVDFEAQLADMVVRYAKMRTNFLTEQAAVAQLEDRNLRMANDIANLKRRLADRGPTPPRSNPARSIEHSPEQRSTSSARA